MRTIAALIVTAMALSVSFTSAALGQSGGMGVPLSEISERGGRLLDSAALSDVLVGNPLVAEDLTTGARYEFVFFHSGVVVQRPQGLYEPSRSGGPSSRIAEYAIEDDRLVTRVGDERIELQFYQIDDRIFAYAPGNEDAPRWRVLRRATESTRPLLVRQFDARGIRPMPEDRLRELVVGRTLTLLKRSTGTYYTVTFREDGTRTLSGDAVGSRAETDYGVFGGSLVTSFGGQTFFITIYDLGGVYLAAHTEDDGVIDWELLSVE